MPAPSHSFFDSDGLRQATYEARDAFYASLGEVDPDVLTPAVSVGPGGQANWPASREAYRLIRRGRHTLVITDGLADAFPDRRQGSKMQGFGLELVLETPELVPPGGHHWAVEAVRQVSRIVVEIGDMRSRIDRLQYISLEIYGVSTPSGWKLEDGAIGVLLGVPAPGIPSRIPLPLGVNLLVPVTLLRPAELACAVEHRSEGRARLAERLAASADGHMSRFDRTSVVPGS